MFWFKLVSLKKNSLLSIHNTQREKRNKYNNVSVPKSSHLCGQNSYTSETSVTKNTVSFAGRSGKEAGEDSFHSFNFISSEINNKCKL